MAARYVKEKVTVRELDVLNILWSSGKPMVASEIVKQKSDLNINTVQAVLRSLLRKKYVEVVDIVYSGTVLSRSYQATDFSRTELVDHFASQFIGMARYMPVPELFASLLDKEDDENVLSELETMINERKRAIEKEK